MAKIAVVYWSGTGNTEAMAESVLEGLKAGGADAELFTVSDFEGKSIDDYDKVAFGCPAMGDEELEQDEFEPFFAELEEGKLNGKKVALFGSYEWNEGDWMKTWMERTKEAGADLFEEGLIVYDCPDDEAKENCKAFGERFAK